VLRSSVKVTFNANYTEATLTHSLLNDWNPLSYLFNSLMKQEVHKGSNGVWKRATYVPPSNLTAKSDTYAIVPVVTMRSDGGNKMHGDGLKLAKRKLAAGGGTLEQCGV